MKINNEVVFENAKALGFDIVGFAEANELEEETANLQEWLQRDYHADMGYMEKNFEKRKDVKKILPSAKSIISLGLNYYSPEQHSGNSNKGKISRYAWGKDYHLIIREKLDKLIYELKNIDLEFEAKSYVDTGPVMDKTWAVHAGLGWLGKHTNVINKEIGSWFFIANIITNYKFDYSIALEDFCGSCTTCIDACPTNAIIAEYVLDSNKCISYQTIENKGGIPENLKGKFDNWIFGCDICQDVCPWNIKFSKITSEKEFFPQNGNIEIDLEEVFLIDQKKFNERFRKTPVKRTKLSGLKRNAKFIKSSIQFNL